MCFKERERERERMRERERERERDSIQKLKTLNMYKNVSVEAVQVSSDFHCFFLFSLFSVCFIFVLFSYFNRVIDFEKKSESHYCSSTV